MSSHAHSHKDSHADPILPYFMVYGALLVLTVFTVLVSTTLNLGEISPALSLGVAMFLATVKGTLVVLFFMHLLHEEKLIPLVLVVALFFLGLFFAMTMADVATRGVGDYVAGSQSFRELNNISVINELPDHGDHGDGHGAEGAAHGEGHAEEGAAHGENHAAEGEAHGDEESDEEHGEGADAPSEVGTDTIRH